MKTINNIISMAFLFNTFGCYPNASPPQKTPIPDSSQPAVAGSASDDGLHDDVKTRMGTLFNAALMRPFGAGGPVFSLPSEYADYFRKHPLEAKMFLEQELQSTNANVRVNALDFVTRIADIPSDRLWALDVMDAAMRDGLAAKLTVEPTYEKLMGERTTQPSS